jgi:hypothetical protein
MRGGVNGELETFVFPGDSWVLVGCAWVKVGRGSAASVNVPLVGSNLVCPRPGRDC